MRYYRKFINDFGVIVTPVTKLLKKEGFLWQSEAVMFTVDYDASSSSFGAILHQGPGALAFLADLLHPDTSKLAFYERELIGLVQAAQYWRPYLWGRRFLVRIDHFSLKYMLDQRLSTVPQHQWISRLSVFNFTVEYRLGR